MIVMFYYKESKTVQLMSDYAGMSFCTYNNVKDVYAGGNSNIWYIDMENGDFACVKADIFERRG